MKIKKCLFCNKFNDDIYEHVFLFCDIYPIRLERAYIDNTSLNDTGKDYVINFIFKSIENIDKKMN